MESLTPLSYTKKTLLWRGGEEEDRKFPTEDFYFENVQFPIEKSKIFYTSVILDSQIKLVELFVNS